MDRKTLIMLILKEAAKQKSWVGRTLLQKSAYFVNVFRHVGIDYRPHYFGPYSDELAASLNSAVAIGLVREMCEALPSRSEHPFESVRYEYTLTDAGKEVLKSNLKGLGEAEVKGICGTIRTIFDASDDYQSLSVAAKVYHILNKGPEQKWGTKQVEEQANQLGWKLAPGAIGNAAKLLVKLIEQ